MQFLLSKFNTGNAVEFYHTWKNDRAKYPAFLDDYAFLIQALIHLQEITGDPGWLTKAKEITALVQLNFREDETGFFFYTSAAQSDVILRKKEVYDGAVPAGNSVMACNLYQLSLFFDKTEWREQSQNMVRSLGRATIKYPGSFGNWACLLQELIVGTNEVVGVGPGVLNKLPSLLKKYIPNRVLMVSETTLSGYPLMEGKQATNRPTFFVCRNYTCHPPVFSEDELTPLINRAPQP
jgi:uncharacterized protein YyaL (SSP411 family)